MIIVSDKTLPNCIYFPRNVFAESWGTYNLSLVDRATNKSFAFVVEDEHIASNGYYSFTLNLSKLPNGEYEWRISETDESGLIRVNGLDTEWQTFASDNKFIIYDTSGCE